MVHVIAEMICYHGTFNLISADTSKSREELFHLYHEAMKKKKVERSASSTSQLQPVTKMPKLAKSCRGKQYLPIAGQTSTPHL